MRELCEMLFLGGALFLMALGFADAVMFLAGCLFAAASGSENEDRYTLCLKNVDTAEFQLRSFLWQLNSFPFRGRLLVVAKDRESYMIAGKILRKYPNIGLLYRGDLHYNIK